MEITLLGEGGKVLAHAEAFGRGQSRITSERLMGELLTVLYDYDCAWLRANPHAPSLYTAGVIYQRESRRGHEEWLSTPEIYRRKVADCEDLGCAKAAEDTVRGNERSYPHLDRKQLDSFYLYHVRTRRLSDKRICDPSRVLGMGRN